MLQKLIDELNEKIQECDVILLNSESMTDHYIQGSAKQSYNEAIALIQSKLPNFEDAIKKAFSDGRLSVRDNVGNVTTQDYYNQKYKK